ncbi:MAG: triphosphoribosyl-dephospho-CoA synthase MdcB [Spirochaetae bacterium HGW-Spirochaetae-3]|jgi:triphosphoribosyl-dephospho-CoA synthetase|nr:MAG: triphosphoribosyl-dephospho-CoA synthase MdcB [Spirochaetae bacterium HGW-Spirochaetae-3]
MIATYASTADGSGPHQARSIGGRNASPRSFSDRVASLAVVALLREAEAAPKPGLVDRFGPGSHTDMDIGHFRRSAAAIEPFFALMAENPSPVELRSLGLRAEAAMLDATGGVNTHKGAIWALGLLCAAAASLRGKGSPRYTDSRLNADATCAEAARLAAGIKALPPREPSREPSRGGEAASNGQVAKRLYGLRSAADEAILGFPSIRSAALPLALSLADEGRPPALRGDAVDDEDERVILVLLAVMSVADDTCVVARGGIAALEMARSSAKAVIAAGGPRSRDGAVAYAAMIRRFAAMGISPGGSADLCAATLFLAELCSRPIP